MARPSFTSSVERSLPSAVSIKARMAGLSPPGSTACQRVCDCERIAQLVCREISGEVSRPQRGSLGGLQAEIPRLRSPASARGRILFHTVHKVQPENIVFAAAADLNAVTIAMRTFEKLATVQSFPALGQQNGLRHENRPCHQECGVFACQRSGLSATARRPSGRSRRHLLRSVP